MYKIEFKLSLPMILTSFPLVAMFLLFVAGGFELYNDLNSVELAQHKSKSTEQVFKVDLQASMAIESAKSIKGLGIDDAEIYFLKVSKKKKGLSGLFSKLKMNKKKNILKVARGAVDSTNTKKLPNYSAFLSQSEKVAMNDKQIKSIIESKKYLFKSCYNKLLLKDALLSGVATVTISSAGSGYSNFKGVGRSKVIKELRGCLNTQVGKIDLSGIDLDKSVRFSLNFSS